ncbi:hypothetical protein EVAR_77182_1 [Eumeta japonica]|uniref:Uncharacterized protein n=1 Tax=Eumeta variegata TaxID=151549 RepID=A0A4C1T204_EUMVA|nr:hypothetical protein EVAR_77182_1 [Eumeta japonica]
MKIMYTPDFGFDRLPDYVHLTLIKRLREEIKSTGQGSGNHETSSSSVYLDALIQYFPKWSRWIPRGPRESRRESTLGVIKNGRPQSFEDILSMEIPPWSINPFDEMEVENVILQEELLELSTNGELKMTFLRTY